MLLNIFLRNSTFKFTSACLFALQPGFGGNNPPFGLRPLGLIDFSDD